MVVGTSAVPPPAPPPFVRWRLETRGGGSRICCKKRGSVVTAWPSRPSWPAAGSGWHAARCSALGVSRRLRARPCRYRCRPRPLGPSSRPRRAVAPRGARRGYLQHVLERVLELEPEPPGEWVQDATGQICSRTARPGSSPTTRPGSTSGTCPWAGPPRSRRPQDAPAPRPPCQPPTGKPRRARRAGKGKPPPWVPLDPPPPNPWRVTRESRCGPSRPTGS